MERSRTVPSHQLVNKYHKFPKETILNQTQINIETILSIYYYRVVIDAANLSCLIADERFTKNKIKLIVVKSL